MVDAAAPHSRGQRSLRGPFVSLEAAVPSLVTGAGPPSAAPAAVREAARCPAEVIYLLHKQEGLGRLRAGRKLASLRLYVTFHPGRSGSSWPGN